MYIKRFVKHYYIMLVPAFLWLFFFSIVPMFGIVMAFQDYNPGQGILHSKFVGLANFEYMFQMSDIAQVLRNTCLLYTSPVYAAESLQRRWFTGSRHIKFNQKTGAACNEKGMQRLFQRCHRMENMI